MDKLLKCVGNGEVRGDCTCRYYYELTRECSVEEIINEILSNKNEWGIITINNIRIDYEHGKIIDDIYKEIPEELKSKKVVKVINGDGGWSRMDYDIIVKKGNEK